MKVNATLALLLLLLLASCKSEQKSRPVFIDAAEETPDHLPRFDLEDILHSGTVVAGTLSGPDTYYEYRGQRFGKQYNLAQDFAQTLGVALRMETAPDTATLIKRLYAGEIDFIALEMPRWETRSTSPNLRSAIHFWWKPLRIQKLIAAMNARSKPRKKARPYMQDRARGIISAYDDLFIRYCPTANIDWRLLAAICFQESAFDPRARSWAGAQGLMQLMPATASGLGVSPEHIYDPETNIAAGTRYIGKLQREFSEIADPIERIKYVLAAYNGGPMHVRDAMALTEKFGGNPEHWDEVSRYILLLSDPTFYRDPIVKHGYMRGSETEAYVRNIMDRWYDYLTMARGGSGVTKPTPSKRHMKDGEHVSHVKTAEEMMKADSAR
ncbi:MAG: transglycosylase SLT domain-containing protein [Bacteroidaceae bacterium]|nr:transglycosylase SLT domain-containing protein [Bacteroidaceae bacterium]